MKTKLVAVSSMALVVLCAWQWRQLHLKNVELTEAKQSFQTEQRERESQEERAINLRAQQSRSDDQIAQLSSLIAASRSAETARAEVSKSPATMVTELKEDDTGAAFGFGGKGMSGMISNMMKDPAMRDMMRAQQKLMVNMMYGGVAKDLSLTAEQNEKLTELLLDQQIKTLEGFTNGAATNSFSELQKSDDSVKAVLGEEKFAQFQEYKKSVAERMQLNIFTQEMQGTQTPLQEEQAKQLIGLILEEREKSTPPISGDSKADPANLPKLLSGDLMEKQMQWQEEINRRVLDRAAEVLTPDQLNAYAGFQKQQLDMQRLGMKMAGAMFGNKDGPADSKSPPPPVKQ